MNIDTSFDDIRPYNDNEIKDVLKRLVEEPGFIKFVHYLNPDCDKNTIKKSFSTINSIKEFQHILIFSFVKSIIAKTTKGLTFSGLEKLSPEKNYLFISNHRDIILDSSFLNVILYENKFDTTEIAIGDNLLAFNWINDLVRINKSFIVHRNLSPRLTYEYSKHLSEYIRYSLTQKHNSIWLAQREGRTKNGDDKTQLSLLKMLNISSDKDIIDSYYDLNIVPLSISYEYDSCDNLKVAELYARSLNPDFKKNKNDDLISMGIGMTTQKGRVNFAIGNPINENLAALSDIKNKNELLKHISILIDKEIYKNYMLYTTNYIAYDISNNSNKFADRYSINEKNEFNVYVNNSLKKISGDKAKLKKMFIDIYANPVINKIKNEVL
ncbi:MAG: 1-acyl-sn-glycerol-3-phosphate acyltransferase [Bacteroidales bacterium]|nr:1-acyl-sn-glycerol-3-phosphate acyltransferase [Bacteroidales bacterium]